MTLDPFDRFIWAAILVVTVALAGLLAVGWAKHGDRDDITARRMDRELAVEARRALREKIYAPVEILKGEGRQQEALLKLDELSARFPNEPQGLILRGELLQQLGALDGAVAAYAEAVRLDGAFVDQRSSSRRGAIERLVSVAEREFAPRAKGNSAAARTMRQVNYLKSRLAGGCE